ncbi:hypothetical protein SAMN02927937_00012 [Paenimyroides aquimaris]|uniref:Lipoprotein n=1 Tax=Paenimyroides marinum TaxID=1159016 RepID=A0A1H6J3M8_9FLAO|nr:DUF6146 family protein [Paenimyroides aquimaris]SEH53414.1 hypothetical protein SAMN02927937_00012 [Paenimyroides aquimaris]
MKAIGLMMGVMLLCFGCASSQNKPLKHASDVDKKGTTVFENGSVKISNPEVEYEVVIFDNQFERWFVTNARPRGYYSKTFLETKNRLWVNNFNSKSRTGTSGFDYTIDYQPSIDYGYEVNYMLYNYLLYFQQVNNLKLD